jgi:hypothetical protein
MRPIRLAFVAALLLAAAAHPAARSNRLITAKAAGPVRLGMTVDQVRKAAPGWSLTRTSDGEGLALIAVRSEKKDLMRLYADEEDPKSRINGRRRVVNIQVLSPEFATAAGVSPGMLIRDVEKRYGRVRSVTLSEIEAREHATFARGPKGMSFGVRGDNGFAGVYPKDAPLPARTTRYAPKARIHSITIPG